MTEKEQAILVLGGIAMFAIIALYAKYVQGSDAPSWESYALKQHLEQHERAEAFELGRKSVQPATKGARRVR